MSLSDCPKCWDTPCTCGWGWESWTTERLTTMRGLLDGILQRRAAGESRRLADYEKPRPPMTAADYQRSITISFKKT